MKCPHCAADDVIDSTNFGTPARVCRRCNGMWRIDAADVRMPSSAEGAGPISGVRRVLSEIFGWRSRERHASTGRGEE